MNQHDIPVKADIVVVCKNRIEVDSLDQQAVNREIMELLHRISNSTPFA